MVRAHMKSSIKKYASACGLGRAYYGANFLFLCLLSYIPIRWVRHRLLTAMGMSIGRGSAVYMGCEIRCPSKISIGPGSIIGHSTTLDGRGGLIIGSNVNLSSGVMIWTAQHDPQSEFFDTVHRAVTIEDHAWVSCRAIILPGVTIGKGAVVAAGAVVTKSVTPFTIVGGVPAVEIGRRTNNLKYHGGSPQPWFI
jgi:acetyltransferase-like isoleucine patch superfamily enzyme